jgi:hypothetical protein
MVTTEGARFSTICVMEAVVPGPPSCVVPGVRAGEAADEAGEEVGAGAGVPVHAERANVALTARMKARRRCARRCDGLGGFIDNLPGGRWLFPQP